MPNEYAWVSIYQLDYKSTSPRLSHITFVASIFKWCIHSLLRVDVWAHRADMKREVRQSLLITSYK